MGRVNTFLHAGRSCTVRPHQDGWLLEWDRGYQYYDDEQRSYVDARGYAFEGRDPRAGQTRRVEVA